jgi:DNA-binding SARP family transcriptional activator
LDLGILGPIEVYADGVPAAMGGVRQRTVLAVLALHPNQVVSVDRLVDDIWGETPPSTAVHTVQVFVSRLRRALAAAGDRLITRPPGYVLELRADELDSDRFERLYETARAALAAGDAEEALALLRQADALWRGQPLAEFTYEPFAQAAIARLEELRINAREELIEAQLALGQHDQVVSELEAFVREHPFRERARGQLMLALYRCGRQAQALDAFQQARKTMVEELAVEPGEALRDLEQAILRQDHSLQLLPARPKTLETPAATQAEPNRGSPGVRVSDQPARGTVRKTVTVLVARLASDGDSDPEKMRSAIGAAREQAEEIVVRHGGAFVAGLGGELAWVFGLPLVREDDALRSLRAADELRAALHDGDPNEPPRLTLRIGIATGEVIAESPSDVFGDPVNRGAALAQAALAMEILISDTTRRLAFTTIRVEPALDGAAWRVLDFTDRQPIPLRIDSPMVGREEELERALAAFDRVRKTGKASLVTVVGEAGIGKSRLVQELGNRLRDEARIVAGRCLSYGEGIAFWPLREALTQLAGEQSRDGIRRLLDSADDADVVADIVAAAVGLAPAESVGEQLPWAVRRVLESLARPLPLLLLIDDAHWADPPLLDLVDYLVDWLRAPVLVVCLARPELLEVRASWGGGRARVSSVVIDRLDDAAARRLLDNQLGQRQMSPTQRAQILRTAEGNPLFVEQLLQLSAEDPAWDRDAEIPGAIQALLSARLDRLGPGERAFVERAALIGREFWPTAVRELLPPEAQSSADKHLRALVHRGLIHPDRSILAGEEQLRFHHILIRDVAYRGTPKGVRCELHERFADWLARRGEQYDEFIGYHLEQAFRYSTLLARPHADAFALARKAGERFAAAGRRALARGDANSGSTLLRSAQELFDAAETPRPDVLIDLGSALGECGEFAEAERVVQQALDQATAANLEALRARACIELSYRASHSDPVGGVGKMQEVAEDAIAVFERIGDEGGLSRAWLHMALVYWIRSDSVDMESALQLALKHAERAGERRHRSRILIDLARTTVIGPLPVGDGIRRNDDILARAEGDIPATAFAEAMLSVLEAMDGRFEDARERWKRSKRRLVDVGLPVTLAVIQMFYAFIELLAAAPKNAMPELAEACTIFEQMGARGHLSSAAALAARAISGDGRTEEYEHYRRLSLDTTSDDDVVSKVLLHSTHAKLLVREGDASGAEELASGAVAAAEGTDFLMLHADALRDRAEVLTLLDRPDLAASDLENAIRLYERKGIRPAAIAARDAQRLLLSRCAAAGNLTPR